MKCLLGKLLSLGFIEGYGLA